MPSDITFVNHPNNPTFQYAIATFQPKDCKDVTDLAQPCLALDPPPLLKYVCRCCNLTCKRFPTLPKILDHIKTCVLLQYLRSVVAHPVSEDAGLVAQTVPESPVLEESGDGEDDEDADDSDDKDDVEDEVIKDLASASDPEANVLVPAPVDDQDWTGPTCIKLTQRGAFSRMVVEVLERIKNQPQKEKSHENVVIYSICIIIIVSWKWQWFIFGICLTFSFVRQVSNPCKNTINLPLTVFHFVVSCVRYTVRPDSRQHSKRAITVYARVLWEQKPRA